MDKILLGHGSGGKLTADLISGLFRKYFRAPQLLEGRDAALLEIPGSTLVFTTDSFVIHPLFYPGGNIGKLAVCGTVNDLAVSGARPLFLSAGFILEEGCDMKLLESVVSSMAAEAEKAGISLVTADTKVVEKGKCDQIFINTSGIGCLLPAYRKPGHQYEVTCGDSIIVNGFIGDHAMAVLQARNDLGFSSGVSSDNACLHELVASLVHSGFRLKWMRDPTRGGLGTLLNELALQQHCGVFVEETAIPVRPEVEGLCELLGFDVLTLANEGKLVLVVPEEETAELLQQMKAHPLGQYAACIGRITDQSPGRVVMLTGVGGRRIVHPLLGEILPRIC
ncbi:MAG TPA: hydrogenase expression/formation protein HypE [Bacteroidales bacterium]|nr:hydrogenase expression/formation protein HypE [Bacteroidales bacterium]HSA42412.1 hydrogenase expression/formation protein HypE [Bacteroidales bacterium]